MQHESQLLTQRTAVTQQVQAGARAQLPQLVAFLPQSQPVAFVSSNTNAAGLVSCMPALSAAVSPH